MNRKVLFTSLEVKYSLGDTQCLKVCTLRLRESLSDLHVMLATCYFHFRVRSGAHHLIPPSTPPELNDCYNCNNSFELSISPFTDNMGLQTQQGGPEWAFRRDGMKNDQDSFTERVYFKCERITDWKEQKLGI